MFFKQSETFTMCDSYCKNYLHPNRHTTSAPIHQFLTEKEKNDCYICKRCIHSVQEQETSHFIVLSHPTVLPFTHWHNRLAALLCLHILWQRTIWARKQIVWNLTKEKYSSGQIEGKKNPHKTCSLHVCLVLFKCSEPHADIHRAHRSANPVHRAHSCAG